jgi:hypothetical protein
VTGLTARGFVTYPAHVASRAVRRSQNSRQPVMDCCLQGPVFGPATFRNSAVGAARLNEHERSRDSDYASRAYAEIPIETRLGKWLKP